MNNGMNPASHAVVKPPLRQPPGPRGHFLFGSMADLQCDRLKFAMDLALEYGDVALFRMGPLPLYMVNHPDGIRHILVDNKRNYSKDTPVFGLLKGLLGNGLLLSEGEFWLRQRRLMQPMFHRERIAGFGQTMTATAEKVLESWRPFAAEGQALDISREMMRLTLDIACRSLFSMDILGEASAIAGAVDIVLEDFTFRFDHPFYPPGQVPTARNRRYHQAVSILDRIVYDMIAQRRRGNGQFNDLLSLLMEARDEDTGEGMTDKQMRDELVTLLIAGHETTANALTWAFYLLSTHPDVQRSLFAEVDAVLGGSAPDVADLPKLEYTRMVIDETMRLYPPAWITNRLAVDEDEICGYRIPKGATVSISPYVTHRLPEFWENPEGFDPLRFTPERVKARQMFAYFPFGGGPRMCIGKYFALTEAALVLATIVQRCRLDLLPGREVRKHPLVTLRPAGGLPMTAHFIGGS
jgi:cytochrome P450